MGNNEQLEKESVEILASGIIGAVRTELGKQSNARETSRFMDIPSLDRLPDSRIKKEVTSVIQANPKLRSVQVHGVVNAEAGTAVVTIRQRPNGFDLTEELDQPMCECKFSTTKAEAKTFFGEEPVRLAAKYNRTVLKHITTETA